MSAATPALLFDRAIERSRSVVVWFSALPRVAKRALVLISDLIALALMMEAAFMLRLGVFERPGEPEVLAVALAGATWTVIAAFRRIYNSVFRYAGSGAMLALARAVAILATVEVLVIGSGLIPGAPRTVSIIHPTLFLLFLFFSRLAIRYFMVDLLRGFDFVGHHRRVLIYGAGAAGQQLASSIRSEAGVELVGFVDDSGQLAGERIDSIPIHHSRFMPGLIEKLEVSDVMLALPQISRRRRQEIIRGLQQFKVHVMTLPGLQQLIEGKVSVQDLREVEIEDLLGRASVPPDEALLAATIQGKVVLVTGAGGSIGSELTRQILAIGPARLILCEQSEYALYAIDHELRGDAEARGIELVAELVNVADPSQAARLFERYRPETVFHAAAYKHVPLVEANPIAGLRNNLFGTLHCALEAERAGVARFVLVSTDKAVRPTNVMGASKRGCELILQALADRGSATVFAMVRFGNVLGSSGSVVPLFKSQIAAGGPVTLTDRRITRYFMTIPEAASLVLQAGAMARGGEVFVLDMGDPVKVADLAATMIRLSGLTVRSPATPDGDIEIVEIGLRPGEKLYEELLIGNDPKPTSHPMIMQAREAALGWAELQDLLREIEAACARGEADAAVALIGRVVPEYNPNPGRSDARNEQPAVSCDLASPPDCG